MFSNFEAGFYTSYFGSVFVEIIGNYPEPYVHLNFDLTAEHLTAVWITFLLSGFFYYVLSLVYLKIKSRKKGR